MNKIEENSFLYSKKLRITPEQAQEKINWLNSELKAVAEEYLKLGNSPEKALEIAKAQEKIRKNEEIKKDEEIRKNKKINELKEELIKEDMENQIEKLWSLLHDEWRAPRKKEDGSFEPRIKSTNDQSWIKKHGTDQVDIANTNYTDLPEDWKGENKISAEIAMKEIYKAINEKKGLDQNFIEMASNIIHEKWLERNWNWAPSEQNKPYSELSEEEKDKDRAIIKKAIEIYNTK